MAGLVALPLRNPGIHRTLGILMRRDKPLSRSAQALLRMVRQHFAAIR
jgi:DNA-binding transcriptional LysR family regulator